MWTWTGGMGREEKGAVLWSQIVPMIKYIKDPVLLLKVSIVVLSALWCISFAQHRVCTDSAWSCERGERWWLFLGPKAALTLPALPLHTTVLLLLYQCRRETEECSGSQNSSQHPVVAEPIILLHSTIVYQQTCSTCYSNKSTGETSKLIMTIPLKGTAHPQIKNIYFDLLSVLGFGDITCSNVCLLSNITDLDGIWHVVLIVTKKNKTMSLYRNHDLVLKIICKTFFVSSNMQGLFSVKQTTPTNYITVWKEAWSLCSWQH